MRLHIHNYTHLHHQNQNPPESENVFGRQRRIPAAKIINVVMFDMDVSENSGTSTPKSSILIGFSIINHPFWGTGNPIFGKHPHVLILRKWPKGLRLTWSCWVSLASKTSYKLVSQYLGILIWQRVGDDDARWWNMWSMCVYSIYIYIDNYVWMLACSSFENLWF